MKWFGITGNLLRTKTCDGLEDGISAIVRSGLGFWKGLNLAVLVLGAGEGADGFFASAGQYLSWNYSIPNALDYRQQNIVVGYPQTNRPTYRDIG